MDYTQYYANYYLEIRFYDYCITSKCICLAMQAVGFSCDHTFGILIGGQEHAALPYASRETICIITRQILQHRGASLM